MPGLDFVKRYQAGGEVAEDETTQPSIPVGKAVASKSPYALPTAAGNVAIDESILTRMQQLIAEREARKGGFAEGMLDAQAWWSGGQAGPYKALTERRAQKEADEATTFGMRRDIAQYRAAQERQKRIAESYGLGGAQPQAGGAPQPQTGGMPPQAGGAGLPPYQVMLNSLPLNIQPIAKRALATEDFETFEKIVGEQQIKKPEMQKNLEYAATLPPEQQEMIRRQLLSEAYKPQTYVGPSGSSYPYSVPGTLPPGVDVPGVPRAAPGRPTAAAPATPARPAVPEKDVYRFENLTPELKENLRQTEIKMGMPGTLIDRPDAAQNFNSLPMERRRAAFEFVPPTTPAQSVATEEPVRRKSTGELEEEKTERTAAATKRGTSSEERRVVFEADTDPSTVTESLVSTKRIQDLVKRDPSLSGVLNAPGVPAAIAKVLEKGVGNFGIADIEQAIYQTLPNTTRKSLGERNELITYLARIELQAAKMIKGQGQITEGEREILARASSSIKDPAEAIYKKAKMLEAIARKNDELGKLYRATDPTATKNFRDFIDRNPQVMKLNEKFRKELTDILNEEVDFSKQRAASGAKKIQHPADIEAIIKKGKKE